MRSCRPVLKELLFCIRSVGIEGVSYWCLEGILSRGVTSCSLVDI